MKGCGLLDYLNPVNIVKNGANTLYEGAKSIASKTAKKLLANENGEYHVP